MNIFIQGTSIREQFVQCTMEMHNLRTVCILHNFAPLYSTIIAEAGVESMPPTYVYLLMFNCERLVLRVQIVS